ncbi:TOBE domain protein [compost metagenome]
MRPEKLRPDRSVEDAMKTGIIQDILYMGNVHKLIVELDQENTQAAMNVSIALDLSDEESWQIGERIGVNWNSKDEVVI